VDRKAKARLVRRGGREAVLAHLQRDPRGNLYLIDLIERLGAPPPEGELRPEAAVAERDGAIAAVVSLRPSIVFDTAAEPAAVEALLPLLASFGVGLVKSPARVVDAVWPQLELRLARSVWLDRYETAYALHRSAVARLPAPSDVLWRPATADDQQPLVWAARESLLEEQRPDPFERDAASFRRWVRGRTARARVVESEGGVVSVAYADVQRSEGWLVQGVYTWPRVRGHGFATAVVSGLCREAFDRGADHVQLAVVDGNAAGKRLYEGLGFEPFDRLRTVLFAEA
jgi:predicted GNAT family acetyltransferase